MATDATDVKILFYIAKPVLCVVNYTYISDLCYVHNDVTCLDNQVLFLYAYTFFLKVGGLSFYFTFPIFIGLLPVQETNKTIEGLISSK